MRTNAFIYADFVQINKISFFHLKTFRQKNRAMKKVVNRTRIREDNNAIQDGLSRERGKVIIIPETLKITHPITFQCATFADESR
ncbi:hypothetical protein NS303_19445 [Pantoea ananatis]|nr:hypothetical protein NS303_19445 [Pantoea ananatis]KTR52377.1 hypothetical protein NS311_20410 [Pantoea ananatis]KTR62733.1 hypothetical protein RSA47_20345 [Pantoea ananatis]KTR67738.1 hypothetical protein NS296_21410 [Pantoea ananatis]